MQHIPWWGTLDDVCVTSTDLHVCAVTGVFLCLDLHVCCLASPSPMSPCQGYSLHICDSRMCGTDWYCAALKLLQTQFFMPSTFYLFFYVFSFSFFFLFSIFLFLFSNSPLYLSLVAAFCCSEEDRGPLKWPANMPVKLSNHRIWKWLAGKFSLAQYLSINSWNHEGDDRHANWVFFFSSSHLLDCL